MTFVPDLIEALFALCSCLLQMITLFVSFIFIFNKFDIKENGGRNKKLKKTKELFSIGFGKLLKTNFF